MNSVPKRRGAAKAAEGKAATLQGGEPSNTPLQTRHVRCWGGDDTAHIGVGVSWDKTFGELKSDLEAAKVLAQDQGKMGFVTRRNFAFAVKPTGYRAGGGAGSFFAYNLEHQGIQIGISKCAHPKQSTPNVRVVIGSLMLMETGSLADCWSIARSFIEALGGRILWNKMSRGDLCVDLPGVCVTRFCQLFDANQFITRSRGWKVFGSGERRTGFTIGSPLILLRVYDKAVESKKEARKRATMVRKRWGADENKATRVEFQLRREALKSLKVDSVEDYLRERSAIARYLTTRWIRFTKGPVDRRNTHRSALHPDWILVVEGFERWTGIPNYEIKRERVEGCNITCLPRQAVGCMASYMAAKTDGEILSRDEFMAGIQETFMNAVTPEELTQIQIEKASEWFRKGPSQNGLRWAEMLERKR